ncbi:MAG: hypothetical protein A2136_02460, partial [Chloroflexi bacterium RBG_16_54_11]
RGLMILTGQLDKERLIPDGEAYVPQPAPPPQEAFTKTFTCPNCGASIAYDPHETTLVCRFCGYKRKVDARVASESSDQVLDAVLPTTPAHRWAESQTRLTCEYCGVTLLLPPGQTADSCPYCASNRFITTPELKEMIDPQVVGLFKVNPEEASRSIKNWLNKGLLAPDDLAARYAGMQLHPAYYPVWLFSGTLEIPWFCDVNEGEGRIARWESHGGSHFEMFKDVLIPGLRSMVPQDLAGIGPFNLDDLVEFSPDFLAGWVALTYDLPLSDASLLAHEAVIKKVRPLLPVTVEPALQKRNFKIGAGRWSGLTYKLALLPIFVGNYPFRGKRFRVFVNGQTGKVAGKQPTDNLKLLMYSLTGLALLVMVIVILWILLR